MQKYHAQSVAVLDRSIEFGTFPFMQRAARRAVPAVTFAALSHL